ncbi:unnamed protein product, partial [Polarella glacialis]
QHTICNAKSKWCTPHSCSSQTAPAVHSKNLGNQRRWSPPAASDSEVSSTTELLRMVRNDKAQSSEAKPSPVEPSPVSSLPEGYELADILRWDPDAGRWRRETMEIPPQKVPFERRSYSSMVTKQREELSMGLKALMGIGMPRQPHLDVPQPPAPVLKAGAALKSHRRGSQPSIGDVRQSVPQKGGAPSLLRLLQEEGFKLAHNMNPQAPEFTPGPHFNREAPEFTSTAAPSTASWNPEAPEFLPSGLTAELESPTTATGGSSDAAVAEDQYAVGDENAGAMLLRSLTQATNGSEAVVSGAKFSHGAEYNFEAAESHPLGGTPSLTTENHRLAATPALVDDILTACLDDSTFMPAAACEDGQAWTPPSLPSSGEEDLHMESLHQEHRGAGSQLDLDLDSRNDSQGNGLDDSQGSGFSLTVAAAAAAVGAIGAAAVAAVRTARKCK